MTELIKKHIDDYHVLAKNSKTHIHIELDFTADGRIFESLQLGKDALVELHIKNVFEKLLKENKLINEN